MQSHPRVRDRGCRVFRFLFKPLKRFAAARRGGVAIMFALCTPMVVAGGGFGAEATWWHYEHLKLQQAMDAAAYAGAIEQRAGSASGVVYSSALAAATTDGFSSSSDTLAVNTPPTSGSHMNDGAVEAIGQRRLNRLFSALFLDGQQVVSARSVASFSTADSACILALDPTASKAANFAGNSATTLTGCDVMANSNSSDAVYVQGSAQLRTPCVMSGGGVNFNNGVTLTNCAAPVTDLPPVADPYRNVPEPTASGNCRNDNGAQLQAGTYCSGMSISGNTNLNPGVYYISSGVLKINANANVTGTGVTFFLAGNASVQMNGNAVVNISAPTSGTYSGLLFFGARANDGSTTNTFNGAASSHMTGAIYFASQEADYLGNFSGFNGCTQVVARTVQWTGSTSVAVDCSAAGMAPIAIGGVVKLAE